MTCDDLSCIFFFFVVTWRRLALHHATLCTVDSGKAWLMIQMHHEITKEKNVQMLVQEKTKYIPKAKFNLKNHLKVSTIILVSIVIWPSGTLPPEVALCSLLMLLINRAVIDPKYDNQLQQPHNCSHFFKKQVAFKTFWMDSSFQYQTHNGVTI